VRRLNSYIHQSRSWPRFSWDRQQLTELVAAVRFEQGRLLGRMQHLGFPLRQEAELTTLTEDVLKTSEIEGENLNPDMVRSSVARHLGLEAGGLQAVDRVVEGVVEMMLDATRRYDVPLTEERLTGWHTSLFPAGRSGLKPIAVGRWRDDSLGPMQVVSGPTGRQRVHFEAPAAKRVPREMERFLTWYNGQNEQDWVVKASLAHLWFVTIHPFDDGNGRIARAIADMSLARSENSQQRFYSMSAQIRRQRNSYYQALEQAQKATMDVTAWMEWFFGCLKNAIEGAQGALAGVLAKTHLWESVASLELNDRQKLVLHRLMDSFEGKLTSSKWAKLAKCSQDSAARDIHDLVAKGVLRRNEEGGRSTSYSLIIPASSAAALGRLNRAG
jgi:Fic family protein